MMRLVKAFISAGLFIAAAQKTTDYPRSVTPAWPSDNLELNDDLYRWNPNQNLLPDPAPQYFMEPTPLQPEPRKKREDVRYNYI
jgi:hypothetical protein